MKPRLLDLFCGAGGAAKGYSDAGFDVTGVDIAPHPDFPYEFICADAMAYLGTQRLAEFDVVHASPPCQAYTSLGRMNEAMGRPSKHPKLVGPVQDALREWGGLYVIENVLGAGLRPDLLLCGSMFDGLRVRRHRIFECSAFLWAMHCKHRGYDFVGVYGDHPESATVGIDGYDRKPRAATVDEARGAMGIDWMGWQDLREAIPPAYTRFIGEQLLAHVAERVA